MGGFKKGVLVGDSRIIARFLANYELSWNKLSKKKVKDISIHNFNETLVSEIKKINLHFYDEKNKHKKLGHKFLIVDGNLKYKDRESIFKRYPKFKEPKLIYIIISLDNPNPFNEDIEELNDQLFSIFKYTPRIVVGYSLSMNPYTKYDVALEKCFDLCIMEYIEILEPDLESFVRFYNPSMDKRTQIAGLTNYYEEQIRQKNKLIMKRKPRMYKRLEKQVVEQALGCLSISMIQWRNLDNVSNMLLGENEYERKEPNYNNKQTCAQFVKAAGDMLKDYEKKIQFLVCGNNLVDFDPGIMPNSFWNDLKLFSLSCNMISTLLFSNAKTGEPIEMPNLIELYASHNCIHSIDVNIANLTRLQLLDLAANQLEEFPPQIIQLTNLRTLDLGLNQLRTVPTEIALLKSLKHLYLDDNIIEVLPFNLFLLEHLEVLHLQNNKLRHLPSTLTGMKQLKIINLANNPYIKDIPQPILLSNIDVIKTYLNENKLRGEECYRTKLLIVGQENVGKTCLINSLKNENIERDMPKNTPRQSPHKTKEYSNIRVTGKPLSTDGIDIQSIFFDTDFIIGNKVVRRGIHFNIWDFAGQEIYYSTHSFFLTDRSIYVVVYNLILGPEECKVEYWLNSIKSRSPTAPILLVGTHLDSDKVKRSKVSNDMDELIKKYKRTFNIKAGIAVSCETGDNIAIVVDKILDIAKEEPYMGIKIPSSYFTLEDLCKMEKQQRELQGSAPICTLNEIEEIARRNEIFSSVSESTFRSHLIASLDVLCLLGSIIRFKDVTPELDDLVILDPQWVTNLFSTIITTKTSFIKEGIIDSKTLYEFVWKEFPSHLHPSLLNLLESFEIVHKLPDDVKIESIKSSKKLLVRNSEQYLNGDEKNKPIRILVPSLLPTAKPELEFLWKIQTEKQEYNRCYSLRFMPNGLFSRFLIRVLHYGDPLRLWRYGVLVKQKLGQSLSLIELDNNVNKITIQTRGKSPAKFMRIIVELLDSLLLNTFKIKAKITTLCPTCIKKGVSNPTKFTKEQCLDLSARGSWFLQCNAEPNQSHLVSMEQIAPDIAMADFEGKRIDIEKDVKILEELGQGAFGTVYRGIYNNEIVAIKQLNLGNQPSHKIKAIFDEFRKEVWIMSSLQHPCIVNLKGFSLQNSMCMIMEILEHGDLFNYINNLENKLDWDLRLRIAWDLAKGLAFLHSTDPPLLHRDVKSPNVLLASTNPTDKYVAKLSDFGLTGQIFVENFAAQNARERDVANPLWLAPEILKEEPYATAADVYPYGIILWELFTRKQPFNEYNFDFLSELEEAIKEGKRPTIPDDCPQDYRRIIEMCVHSDPEQRPSFKVIIEELLPPLIDKYAPNIKPSIKIIEEIEKDMIEVKSIKITKNMNNWIKGKHLATVEISDIMCNMAYDGVYVWCMSLKRTLYALDSDTGKLIGKFENCSPNKDEQNIGLFYNAHFNHLYIVEPSCIIAIDTSSIESVDPLWNPIEGIITEIEMGKKKKRKQRYCCLDESVLKIYKSKEDVTPDLEFMIEHCNIELQDGCMILVYNDCTYYFADDDEIDWFERIKFFIDSTKSNACKLKKDIVYTVDEPLKIVAFNSCGDKLIVVLSNKTIEIYDNHLFNLTQKIYFSLLIGQNDLTAFPNASFELVDEYLWFAYESNLLIIDLAEGKIIDSLQNDNSNIVSILSLDNEVWACTKDRNMRVYDKSGKFLFSFKCNELINFMIKIGSQVLISHISGLEIWKSSKRQVEKYLERRHEDPVTKILLIDEKIIWTLSNVSINIWT